MRDERLRRLAYPQSGFCSRSNPSPGTKISKPVFGWELFVAHKFCRIKKSRTQLQLIHKLSTAEARAKGRTVNFKRRLQSHHPWLACRFFAQWIPPD
jgi:hypothetical protein